MFSYTPRYLNTFKENGPKVHSRQVKDKFNNIKPHKIIMKKSSIFWIVLLVIIVLLSINFLFHLIYFNAIYKNIRPASESEKQKAIEILNQSLSLNDYQVKIGNVYASDNKELVQVELIKGSTKKNYLIDLGESRIIRK
jgi:uncharacterized membrane protein YvbJ